MSDSIIDSGDYDTPEFICGEVLEISKTKEQFSKDFAPSIILHNPKYPHNIGACVRALSCFGGKALIFTGDRIMKTVNGKQQYKGVKSKKGYRFPREERMAGYRDVMMLHDQYPLNRFSKDVVPVAVEVRDNSESLTLFEHPKDAVYVFGPEDGSLPQTILQHCQRFVIIPSKHCLNLAAAVNVILYDRISKEGITRHEDLSKS